MPRKYNITNPSELRQWTRSLQRDIQKEWNREAKKSPLRLPVSPDHALSNATQTQPVHIQNTYHGPVVNGDGTKVQFASNVGGDVHQSQPEIVSEGYEQIAQVLNRVLRSTEQLVLNDSERKQAAEEAQAALSEIVKDTPNPTLVKKALTVLKGIFSPIALGIQGAATEVTRLEATDLIRELGEATQLLQ